MIPGKLAIKKYKVDYQNDFFFFIKLYINI